MSNNNAALNAGPFVVTQEVLLTAAPVVIDFSLLSSGPQFSFQKILGSILNQWTSDMLHAAASSWYRILWWTLNIDVAYKFCIDSYGLWEKEETAVKFVTA